MLNEQQAAIVSFTPAALDKLAEVMTEQDATDSYLRISAAPTPQGGVEYAFGLEDEPADDDTSLEDGAVKALGRRTEHPVDRWFKHRLRGRLPAFRLRDIEPQLRWRLRMWRRRMWLRRITYKVEPKNIAAAVETTTFPPLQ